MHGLVLKRQMQKMFKFFINRGENWSSPVIFKPPVKVSWILIIKDMINNRSRFIETISCKRTQVINFIAFTTRRWACKFYLTHLPWQIHPSTSFQEIRTLIRCKRTSERFTKGRRTQRTGFISFYLILIDPASLSFKCHNALFASLQ